MNQTASFTALALLYLYITNGHTSQDI